MPLTNQTDHNISEDHQPAPFDNHVGSFKFPIGD